MSYDSIRKIENELNMYTRVVRFPRALWYPVYHQPAHMDFFVKCDHLETFLNFFRFLSLFVIFLYDINFSIRSVEWKPEMSSQSLLMPYPHPWDRNFHVIFHYNFVWKIFLEAKNYRKKFPDKIVVKN